MEQSMKIWITLTQLFPFNFFPSTSQNYQVISVEKLSHAFIKIPHHSVLSNYKKQGTEQWARTLDERQTSHQTIEIACLQVVLQSGRLCTLMCKGALHHSLLSISVHLFLSSFTKYFLCVFFLITWSKALSNPQTPCAVLFRFFMLFQWLSKQKRWRAHKTFLT